MQELTQEWNRNIKHVKYLHMYVIDSKKYMSLYFHKQ